MTSATPRERDENEMTYQEFIALTDDELRRRIAAPDPYSGVGYYSIEAYRDELLRRETAHQNQRLEALTETLVVLTRRLHSLTVGVVVLTVVLVVLEVLRI